MCVDCGWDRPMSAMMSNPQPEEDREEARAHARDIELSTARWVPGPHTMVVTPMPEFVTDWSADPFATPTLTGRTKYIDVRCLCGATQRTFRGDQVNVANAFNCRFARRKSA